MNVSREALPAASPGAATFSLLPCVLAAMRYLAGVVYHSTAAQPVEGTCAGCGVIEGQGTADFFLTFEFAWGPKLYSPLRRKVVCVQEVSV